MVGGMAQLVTTVLGWQRARVWPVLGHALTHTRAVLVLEYMQ